MFYDPQEVYKLVVKPDGGNFGLGGQESLPNLSPIELVIFKLRFCQF